MGEKLKGIDMVLNIYRTSRVPITYSHVVKRIKDKYGIDMPRLSVNKYVRDLYKKDKLYKTCVPGVYSIYRVECSMQKKFLKCK